MSGSKRYLPIAIACAFLGSTGIATAGSQSALDPDSFPKSSGSGMNSSSGAGAGSSQTYVTMPAPEGKSKLPIPKMPKAPKISLPKLPKIGMHKEKKETAKPMMADLKPANSERNNERSSDHNNGTSKLAQDSKSSGGGIMDKTKGIGQSIANGAKSSGSFFMSGAKKIGNGFKTAGSKVKDGTESMGSKVAKLSPFSHGGKDKSDNSSATIAAKQQVDTKKQKLGPQMEQGAKFATRKSKVSDKLATRDSRVAGNMPTGGQVQTRNTSRVAGNLPVKTTFGQVNDDWAAPRTTQPLVTSNSAPNKVSGKHGGGFFGKIASPFGGNKSKQIAAGSAAQTH